MSRMRFLLLAALGLAVTLSDTAFAYIGPGGGLTALRGCHCPDRGILLAIVGFVWYPIKAISEVKTRV